MSVTRDASLTTGRASDECPQIRIGLRLQIDNMKTSVEQCNAERVQIASRGERESTRAEVVTRSNDGRQSHHGWTKY
jgi:hypothetical protein